MHRLHDGSEKWKDVVDRKIGGGVPVFQYDHCLYYNIIIIHIGILSLCLYSIVLNMLSLVLLICRIFPGFMCNNHLQML